MPVKPLNLQDNFLNQMRKENRAVSIHLLNGFQMKGYVKGFDNFTVILEVAGCLLYTSPSPRDCS